MPAAAPLDPGARRALRLLRATFAAFIFGLTGGTAWDIYWHSQYTFDSFWTPPHLLLYAGVSAAGVFAALAAATPALRRSLGAPARLPFVRFPVPLALVLTGTGVAAALAGGAMDDYWHSTWGLDETRWSLPHATISWGVFLVLLGLTSCRVALAGAAPLCTRGRLFLATLFLLASAAVFLGPFFFSTTPTAMDRTSRLPGFQSAATSRYFAIVAHWDLYRTNPLFLGLLGAWCGFAFAFVRWISPPGRLLVLAAAAATLVLAGVGIATALYIGAFEDLASWVPLPVLPAALVLVAFEQRGLPEPWPSLGGGAAVGALAAAVYGPSWAAALGVGLAALAWCGAAAAGRWAWTAVQAPTPKSTASLIALFGVALPLLLGALDLFMRQGTR